MQPYYYHKNGLDLFTACEKGLVPMDEFKSFCKLNIVKYILRYEDKNGGEDLIKAQDYLNKLIKIENVTYGERLHETIIPQTSNCDTRTATHKVTKEELFNSSQQHIKDVNQLINLFSKLLIDLKDDHDWTKISKINEFYDDYNTVQENPEIEFTELKWAKYHYNMERHHLNSKKPVEVNLFDVVEMVCDCIAAGVGRSGEVDLKYFEIMDKDLLQEAMFNTVKQMLPFVRMSNGELPRTVDSRKHGKE